MLEEVIIASQRTWNPVNVSSIKGLRPQGTFGVHDLYREVRSGSTRCDRDPHFNSDACEARPYFPGSKTA